MHSLISYIFLNYKNSCSRVKVKIKYISRAHRILRDILKLTSSALLGSGHSETSSFSGPV